MNSRINSKIHSKIWNIWRLYGCTVDIYVRTPLFSSKLELKCAYPYVLVLNLSFYNTSLWTHIWIYCTIQWNKKNPFPKDLLKYGNRPGEITWFIDKHESTLLGWLNSINKIWPTIYHINSDSLYIQHRICKEWRKFLWS